MCVHVVCVLKTHSLFGGWLWVRSGVCFPGFGDWHRSCVPVSVYSLQSGYCFGLHGLHLCTNCIVLNVDIVLSVNKG